ncbi:4Fe-4S dicluster domain-containing protein [Heliobacillus mobilis]|uniref:Ferredoxin n=1 Tax=Heliobacterium mobile TaxID=28064 RepID=A0A6I3SP74_HELMO|nr:4Fe-4S binding protein [Heliobacterium mobile]MTV50047.1 4Fe-4S dicluster domain-containing protein [Heliobacterium mobile]
MAFFITSACINCGVCENECPVECISSGRDVFIIDPDKCIDCGACFNVCPVDAPQPQ